MREASYHAHMSFLHRVLLRLSLLTVLLAGAGCVSVPHPQPREIVVVNRSGQDAEAVSIREYRERPDEAVRMGSVSPLLNGIPYSITRRRDAAPLPDRVVVAWTVSGESPIERIVTIGNELRRSTGDDALIFELQPRAEVRVFLSP